MTSTSLRRSVPVVLVALLAAGAPGPATAALPDLLPPQAPTIVAPAPNQTLSGPATRLAARAEDDPLGGGVARVEFRASAAGRAAVLLGTARSAGGGEWAVLADSYQLVNGTWSLVATAFDAAGNSTASAPVAFVVDNPSGPLTRYGSAVVRNGPASFDLLKAGPRVVARTSTGFRMLYEAVGSDGTTTIALATSPDGLTWTKAGPVMRPTLTWERQEVSPATLVVDGGLYRLWYHGGGYLQNGTRLGNTVIGYATSTDAGLTWTKRAAPVLGNGPTGAFDANQAAEPRVLQVGSTYRMFYTGQATAGGPTSLGTATSADGITWTKSSANPVIPAARWGNQWGGAFFYENGSWRLWRAKLDTPKGSLHFAYSVDGLVWKEGPVAPVLGPTADTTAPDAGSLGDSVSGYRDGTAYRILYTGFNRSYGGQGRFEGICMASVSSSG